MTSYVPEAARHRVIEALGDCCSYCLAVQQYVLSKFEIGRMIPVALGGGNDGWNLCLARRLRNLHKSDQIEAADPVTKTVVALLNPRAQAWGDNFRWSRDGVIIVGLTPVGRVTVEALRLNNEIAVEVRRDWALVGWRPPSDVK